MIKIPVALDLKTLNALKLLGLDVQQYIDTYHRVDGGLVSAIDKMDRVLRYVEKNKTYSKLRGITLELYELNQGEVSQFYFNTTDVRYQRLESMMSYVASILRGDKNVEVYMRHLRNTLEELREDVIN